MANTNLFIGVVGQEIFLRKTSFQGREKYQVDLGDWVAFTVPSEIQTFVAGQLNSAGHLKVRYSFIVGDRLKGITALSVLQ